MSSSPNPLDHRIRVRTRSSAAATLGESVPGPPVEPRPLEPRPVGSQPTSPLVEAAPPAPGRRFLPADPRLRLLLLVGATVLAYQHSLRDLTRTLSYDTPLAYLGIVPVLALVLGVVRARDAHPAPTAPHRQVDWIISLPLLAVAAWVATVLPDRLGYSFWTSRIDILGLPFFVAGLTALLFGTRILRRAVPAVFLLASAWPFPYERVIDDVLVAAQRLTLAAVRVVAGSVGARNTTDALFEIGDGAGSFVVNVAPQCAGASSVVGWLLLGSTVCLALPAGHRFRKAAWLLAGVGVLVTANIARIAGIFAVGSTFGEQVAIDWVHPYVGLLIFMAAVVILVRLLPVFGLAPIGSLLPPPGAKGSGSGIDRTGLGARRLTAPVLAVLVMSTAVLHPVNTSLERFDPFRHVDATNASVPFAAVSGGIDGYQGAAYDQVEWGQQYFGVGSTWIRHRYQSSGVATPIYVDVISTTDLHAFSEFGVEACYRFHDYGIVDQGSIDVGAAAPAQHLTFFNLDTGTWWSAMAVVQPVDAGGQRRYERVLSLLPLGGYDPETPPDVDRIDDARRDLADFARATVRAASVTV